MDDNIQAMIDRIDWLGHASFRIRGAKTIYIDPWKLPADVGGDGELVLVSHDHYDHLSPNDIRKALAKGGQTAVAECCRAKFPKADHYLMPYTKHKLNGVDVYVTAAYNVNKQFHPREQGHCGFILTLDGMKIYHTGDCDAFPHMRDLTCDIMLLPVSGTYVMNPSEAVDAVNMVKPKVAIPMHWGDPDVVGSRTDAEEFKRLASCEVVIKEPLR